MHVEEIQEVIRGLPRQDLARLVGWLEEFLADEWDRQIESDILAGRWDATFRRGEDDARAGRAKPVCP